MKAVVIEELVRWAYGQELPKLDRATDGGWSLPSGSSGWDMVAEIAMLGTVVDRSGAVPSAQFAEPEGPHPDALAVHHAVLGLAGSTLTMPEGFDALRDCTGLTEAERIDVHQRGFVIASAKGDRLAALLIRRGAIGDVPTWRDHGSIARRPVLGANGRERWFRVVNASAGPGRPAQPQEVDGLDKRTQRPMRGAYRKTYLDPCPSLLVAERIEYQTWVLALDLLADALAGRMTAHRALPPSAPLWPWEGEGERVASRILLARSSTGDAHEAKSAA